MNTFTVLSLISALAVSAIPSDNIGSFVISGANAPAAAVPVAAPVAAVIPQVSAKVVSDLVKADPAYVDDESRCFRGGFGLSVSVNDFHPPCWKRNDQKDAWECFEYLPGGAEICPGGTFLHTGPEYC